MRGFRLLWVLIVSLVLLYVAIGAILAHQYRSLSEIMRSGDDNALWAFAQLSTEYQRFDHALHTYILDPILPRRSQASGSSARRISSWSPSRLKIHGLPCWLRC